MGAAARVGGDGREANSREHGAVLSEVHGSLGWRGGKSLRIDRRDVDEQAPLRAAPPEATPARPKPEKSKPQSHGQCKPGTFVWTRNPENLCACFSGDSEDPPRQKNAKAHILEPLRPAKLTSLVRPGHKGLLAAGVQKGSGSESLLLHRRSLFCSWMVWPKSPSGMEWTWGRDRRTASAGLLPGRFPPG